MTRAAPVEAQVRHMLKGAQAAGFAVAAIERLPDGTIRLVPGQPVAANDDPFAMVEYKR